MDLEDLMRNTAVEVDPDVGSDPERLVYGMRASLRAYGCSIRRAASPGFMLFSARGGTPGFSLSVIYAMACDSGMSPGDRMIFFAGPERAGRLKPGHPHAVSGGPAAACDGAESGEIEVGIAVLADGSPASTDECIRLHEARGLHAIDNGSAMKIVNTFLAGIRA